jgi:hypothetical protein
MRGPAIKAFGSYKGTCGTCVPESTTGGGRVRPTVRGGGRRWEAEGAPRLNARRRSKAAGVAPGAPHTPLHGGAEILASRQICFVIILCIAIGASGWSGLHRRFSLAWQRWNLGSRRRPEMRLSPLWAHLGDSGPESLRAGGESGPLPEASAQSWRLTRLGPGGPSESISEVCDSEICRSNQ